MKKKMIFCFVLVFIVGVLGFVLYNFNTQNEDKTENKIEYKKVTISSDEECIAHIYYDYMLGKDASRGYDIFIYKDDVGYKYEIKSGKVTIAGPSELKTEGYGRLYTKDDIEKLNEKYENKKRNMETFSIKYRIMHSVNDFEYCELDEFIEFLF